MNKVTELALKLKDKVDTYGMVDVGYGVARQLGVTQVVLDKALMALEHDGYQLHLGRLPGVLDDGKIRTIKAICAPSICHKDIFTGVIHRIA